MSSCVIDSNPSPLGQSNTVSGPYPRQCTGYDGYKQSYKEKSQNMSIHPIFEHRHSLSIDVTSSEEFNMITAQLEKIEQPANGIHLAHASCFSRSSTDGESYWLCYYYERISMELLSMLTSLQTRYTLHDTITHEDSLRFWPDYSEPQGILAPLLQKAQ